MFIVFNYKNWYFYCFKIHFLYSVSSMIVSMKNITAVIVKCLMIDKFRYVINF